MSDFHIKAILSCGVTVEVRQPGTSQVLELTLTNPEGTAIKDTAWIENGNLRINATIEGLVGFYQLLGLMLGQKKKSKFSWFWQN
jgi:hypothetical protein